MKKKIFISTFAIAAMALTAFTGYKTFGPKQSMSDLLLDENIEALTQGEEPYPEERTQCVANGGNWNMASICEASGFEKVYCSISGELTFLGVTIRGSYTSGKTYPIAWARYKCVESSGNCCKKQGMYSGDQQLA